MGRDVRFIVLNGEEQLATTFRSLLLSLEGVKIVAEVDEPALLAQAVKQFPVDVVLANLDPHPDVILPVIAEVAGAASAPLIFATSASTEGPLILKTMRAGVREFLPKPIDAHALEEAVSKIAVQRAEGTPTGTLVTVTGASGGAGASMLAANLAAELATLATGTVAVVDLDYRFGQVATLLDVEPTYTLADLCHSPEHLETQVIERALVKHSSGLQVLSRPATFAQADTITAANCIGLLSTLLQINEYVVTDGPNRADLNARSVLDLSDVHLLVVQLLVPTVRNASRILDAMREGGYNLERVKLVCNRVGRESVALSVDDIAETLALKPYASIPDDWATVSGAINLGETLAAHSPKSKVRLAIREIAERLHSPAAGSDDKDTRKKGLIERIFTNA
ncbi:MAG: hypothetical protein HY763_04950 [Planctomycetes bacterium]|nr:hypothetical protein [Planctomycetota bacterium]